MWIENCVLTTAAIGDNATGADSATLKITDSKLYDPVVILSTEDKAKLAQQLSKGFKRIVYWNKYKVIDNRVADCLFLLIIIQQATIKFLLILSKKIFFQE